MIINNGIIEQISRKLHNYDLKMCRKMISNCALSLTIGIVTKKIEFKLGIIDKSDQISKTTIRVHGKK